MSTGWTSGLHRLIPALLLAVGCALAVPSWALCAQEIRVLLDEENTLQTVSGELSWSSEKGAIGNTDGDVNIGLSGGGVVTRVQGTQHYARRLTAVPRSGYAGFGGREYRGRLEFFPGKAGGVVVLNVLPVEDYLAGVVPAEMPPSWPHEALRAQAVAARTYALSRMAAMQDATYDVASTTSDQMYRGVAGEDPRSTQAVQDTAGEILTYRGHPIVAYFCSDAGGYTRSGSEPYLKSVPSLAVESPYNDWSFELSAAELAELVAATGSDIGTITGSQVQHEPVSGHLIALTLSGTGGSCTFSGVQLRRYIGRSVMRSTRVRFEPMGNAQVTSRPAPRAVEIAAVAGARTQYETLELAGYTRPWVASGERDRAIKMRSMYAYNGCDLEQCNRLVHVYADETDRPDAAPAAPAAADTTAITASGGLSGLIVHGSGYGHGMGMSQWGARQLAGDGYDYAVILNHFYTGVQLIRWNGDVVPAAPPADDSSFYKPFDR